MKKRRPVGRPRKKDSEKRKEPMRSIRVSEAEWGAWQETADRLGLSMSAYIRAAANAAINWV